MIRRIEKSISSLKSTIAKRRSTVSYLRSHKALLSGNDSAKLRALFVSRLRRSRRFLRLSQKRAV